MQRLVFDTNIRVSSVVFGGLPKRLMDLCQLLGWQPVISLPLLEELKRILSLRFAWSSDRVRAEAETVLATSLQVAPKERVTVCRDPEDDRVLECAVEGRAEWIVTGDRDLLSLGSFRGIRIVTAREFFDHLRLTEDYESQLP